MEHETTQKERNIAVIMHLSPLMGVLIPLLGFIIPIGLWYFKKEESEFINERGKEIFNFMITALIETAVSMGLTFILIGYLFLYLIGLYVVIFSIIAALRTSEGEEYRYPFIIRLIK